MQRWCVPGCQKQQSTNTMKRSLFLCLCLVAVVACKKHKGDDQDLIDDHGCIERVTVPVTEHYISSTQVDTVNQVFDASGIAHTNFRYVYFSHDSVSSYNPPYTKTDNIYVIVQQYMNEMPVLLGSLQYSFQNGVLITVTGNTVTTVNLDTVPHLDLVTLRKLFITDMQRVDHNAAQYKDTCLAAQFGYYTLVTNTVTNERTIIKAWLVSRKGRMGFVYPQGMYRDDNGSRIYYSNGIMLL